jgi:RNA polymerase sigma-70 factor, ECF subfamily
MSENGNMASAADQSDDLESFRPYLQVLAESQLHQRLQSKVDAADLVQQTMLQAYQAREQFRGSTGAEKAAWLRTILNNIMLATARDFSRQSRDVTREQAMVALEASSMHLANLLAATSSSPSAAMHRQERANRLAQAMLTLTSEQRQAIMLKYWHGFTLSDIAQQLEKSTEAVAGLIFRGMQKLRSRLDGL